MSDTENKENVTEPVKEEEKKKPKKEKKPKKVKIPFDKIDITTASEDDIIESGKWHNTKADITCYLIMACIFVAMILPLVLRKVIPKPITEEIRTIVYVELNCFRARIINNYEISSKVSSIYRDGSTKEAVVSFTYKANEGASDEFTFADVEELKNLDLKGLKMDDEVGKYTFTIDYYNNPELDNNEVLSKYSHVLGDEINQLKALGYYCTTKSEEKEELVYVDTGRKVED